MVKFKTLEVRVAAIAFVHELADLPSPISCTKVRGLIYELRLEAGAERARDADESGET